MQDDFVSNDTKQVKAKNNNFQKLSKVFKHHYMLLRVIFSSGYLYC